MVGLLAENTQSRLLRILLMIINRRAGELIAFIYINQKDVDRFAFGVSKVKKKMFHCVLNMQAGF